MSLALSPFLLFSRLRGFLFSTRNFGPQSVFSPEISSNGQFGRWSQCMSLLSPALGLKARAQGDGKRRLGLWEVSRSPRGTPRE